MGRYTGLESSNLTSTPRSLQRLVLRTTYGKAVSFTSDELWKYVAHTGERAEPSIAPILSCFPILKYWPRWLPGGGFHKIADTYFKEDKAVWEKVRDDVKAGMVSCIGSRYVTDDQVMMNFQIGSGHCPVMYTFTDVRHRRAAKTRL